MNDTVSLSKLALKQPEKAPVQVVAKMRLWVDTVENEGLEAVRLLPGYHDEPLKGMRRGQRSVRLSRKYGAINVVFIMRNKSSW